MIVLIFTVLVCSYAAAEIDEVHEALQKCKLVGQNYLTCVGRNMQVLKWTEECNPSDSCITAVQLAAEDIPEVEPGLVRVKRDTEGNAPPCVPEDFRCLDSDEAHGGVCETEKIAMRDCINGVKQMLILREAFETKEHLFNTP